MDTLEPITQTAARHPVTITPVEQRVWTPTGMVVETRYLVRCAGCLHEETQRTEAEAEAVRVAHLMRLRRLVPAGDGPSLTDLVLARRVDRLSREAAAMLRAEGTVTA